MTESQSKIACAEKIYIITKADLPLSCPTHDMVLWNAHPRVYLPIDETKFEVCPYCGTKFVLETENLDIN